MKDRFIVFRRQCVFYYQDRFTGQQKSLQTRDRIVARRILQAKNETVHHPMMNFVMARTYLAAQDPKLISRTWADVMNLFRKRGKPAQAMQAQFARSQLEVLQTTLTVEYPWNSWLRKGLLLRRNDDAIEPPRRCRQIKSCP